MNDHEKIIAEVERTMNQRYGFTEVQVHFEFTSTTCEVVYSSEGKMVDHRIGPTCKLPMAKYIFHRGVESECLTIRKQMDGNELKEAQLLYPASLRDAANFWIRNIQAQIPEVKISIRKI